MGYYSTLSGELLIEPPQEDDRGELRAILGKLLPGELWRLQIAAARLQGAISFAGSTAGILSTP